VVSIHFGVLFSLGSVETIRLLHASLDQIVERVQTLVATPDPSLEQGQSRVGILGQVGLAELPTSLEEEVQEGEVFGGLVGVVVFLHVCHCTLFIGLGGHLS